MANLIQSSELPPAQPAYVLRGHSAQIHAVHFFRNNTRLLTGDADGFVVLWCTTTKRAAAVWKAATNSILGVGSWDHDKIITHGRDNKLHVWQLREADEAQLSKISPLEDAQLERKQPWLLHTLTVNSLNFCSFAMIKAPADGHNDLPSEVIFIATPGVQDGHVNVTSLPDEERIATIPTPKGENTGMTMAIGLHFEKVGAIKELVVVAGYESGHVCVWQQEGASRKFQLTYLSKAHTQPVLSLGIAMKQGSVFTSSADAIIARHPLGKQSPVPKTIQTKHAGQQGLAVRDDEKIFATAGWDGRLRVYSVKTMKELAVLKWHQEGCYAVGFASVAGGGEQKSALENNNEEGERSEAVQRNMTAAEQREEKARTTHWLAAGSKDGKVSLWDIY